MSHLCLTYVYIQMIPTGAGDVKLKLQCRCRYFCIYITNLFLIKVSFLKRCTKEMSFWQGLSRVRECLATLIQHNCVVFAEREGGPFSNRAEYTLVLDNCLQLIRYSKCLALAKTLYHDEGEIIVEELFAQGQDSASNLIFRAAQRLNPTETPVKALPTGRVY